MQLLVLLIRCLLLAALIGVSLQAQFRALSSPADGSSLHFVSTLRLKGSAQPHNGKVFALTLDGVRLVRARESEDVAPETPPCQVGGFQNYVSAEARGDAVAFVYYANAAGGCSYPPNVARTQIVTRSGEIDLPGVVRLSPDGRRAVRFHARTARHNAVDIFFVDLRTGEETAAIVPDVGFPPYGISVPLRAGQIIANDGTTLFNVSGSTQHRGYILRPGADPDPFPVEDAQPLVIDESGSQVLYEKDGLHLLDLRSGHSNLVAGPREQNFLFSEVRMSDDASRVIFIQDGQMHLVETGSGMSRKLTDNPFGIAATAISGDAETVYAVPGQGRLLRIDPSDGSQTELIGKTPYIDPYPSGLIPGLAATLRGSGLSDSVITGTPPFDPYLGKVTMWIDERKVPLVELKPNSIRFLVPWDVESNGSIRLLAEAPGDNTPFYYPEAGSLAEFEEFEEFGGVWGQRPDSGVWGQRPDSAAGLVSDGHYS